LSRAALMFAGAATVAACSSSASQPSYGVFTDSGLPNRDAMDDSHRTPELDAGHDRDAASADSRADSGADSSPDADADAFQPVNMDAAYGVVILADAGSDAGTDSGGDAFNPGGGSDDGGDPGNGGAAYGSFVNPP
jgi:hypothetical protein